MKFYFKSEVYFEFVLEDNQNGRQPTQKAFHEVVEPIFEVFLEKVKFTKETKNQVEALTGQKVDLRLLSKKQFVKTVGQKL